MCEPQPAAVGPGRTSAGAGFAGRPPAPPVGAAIALFAGGLSRWAVDVTVIDDAITRRVAGVPVPGFTAVASVIAEAGAALATVIAGFVLRCPPAGPWAGSRRSAAHRPSRWATTWLATARCS